MSNKKPTFHEFVTFAHEIGFKWFSTGSWFKDNQKYGEYLMGDKLSKEQEDKLIDKFDTWVVIKHKQVRSTVFLLSKKAHDKTQT